jgi:ubiquinone/menaquinone biosynthesis C-methylase UbiE
LLAIADRGPRHHRRAAPISGNLPFGKGVRSGQKRRWAMHKHQSTDEIYQHGHHASVVADHAKRTAEVCAAFFLPLLKPGMRLLDVGCGPGTITAGLARRVAPGETIGIDMSPGVIDTANALVQGAADYRLSFEVGNVYQPRFAADSFDAIFAHQVLQHLRHPSEALRCMHALLASGGVLGVREVDWGGTIFYPDNPGMRRFLELYYELARRNGGEPNAGRHLRRWLRQAGFAEARVATSTTCYADAAATREWGETYAQRTLYSNIGDKALEYGLATPRELESIAAGWRAWGSDADAFFCLSHTEVVAWKRPRPEGG